jgi:hypothetical protein
VAGAATRLLFVTGLTPQQRDWARQRAALGLRVVYPLGPVQGGPGGTLRSRQGWLLATADPAGWLERELGEVYPPSGRLEAEPAGSTSTPGGTAVTDSGQQGGMRGEGPSGSVPAPLRWQPPAPWLADRHLGGGVYDLDDGQETRLHGYVLEVTRSGLWLRDASPGLDPLSGEDRRLAATARSVRLLPLDPGAVDVVVAAPGQLVSEPAWEVLNDVLSELPAEARSRIRLLVPAPDRDGRWAGASRLAAALGPAATVQHLTADGYPASPTTPVDFASTAADPAVRSGLTPEQHNQLARQRPRYRTSTEDLYRLDGRPPQEVRRDGLLPRPEARSDAARRFDIQGHIRAESANAFVSLTRDPNFATRHANWVGDNYRYLYRIDGARALGGIDPNATPGVLIDAPNQQEILFVGGVAAPLIVEVWELTVDAQGVVTMRPVPWEELEP